MPDDIEIIVRGVLIHDGKLLVCRNRKHGHLFLPGGHVEFNEAATFALEREVKEELGIHLTVGDLLGACEAAFDQPKREGMKRHHEINLVFRLITPPAFQPTSLQSQEDHIAFDWVNFSEMPALRILPLGITRLLDGNERWISVM